MGVCMIKDAQLKKLFLCVLFLGCSTPVKAEEEGFYSQRSYCQRRTNKVFLDRSEGKKTFGDCFSDILKDAFYIHKNLLSWDTLKVAAAIVPSALIARKFDEKIQCNFYDAH